MGRKGETFPGLKVIRGEQPRPPRDGEPHKGPRRRRTPEELAKLPPSLRARVGRRKLEPLSTSKLTPELIDQIVERMATGAPVETCAGTLGVTRPTVQEWLAKGGDPARVGTLWHRFALAVARARDDFRLATYGRIAMGERGYQGAAWLAERLFPELAPPTKKLEHSGTGAGGAIRITGSVELPAEIPDGHPSLTPARATNGAANGHASLTPRGVAESSSNGHAVPILAEGVSLPPEEDPD